MSVLCNIILSKEPEIRDRPLDAFCKEATLETLLRETQALDKLRRNSENLYERVRALFFLYAIHRFHLPTKPYSWKPDKIPYEGVKHLLKRRFEEALEHFLAAQAQRGPSDALSSALATAYKDLAFQTLANQVRRSVRSVKGNQWMFRIGHPKDHPLRVDKSLYASIQGKSLFPVLQENTPVRMDLTHSAWSDIFFLGMDFPEGARVLNASVDLAVQSDEHHSEPVPPIETYFRVIDRPVLRLVSVDLKAMVEIETLAEVFDFASDYLGLLKAAVIASGIVPSGLEGAEQPLSDLLETLIAPGYGIEIVSKVNGIPKGSRLAVSTNLLASLISVCMRATGQTNSMEGVLQEEERRLVAARAILGEWLGGSGGGWQDSGGIWPGMKLIEGVIAKEGDPEYGISRGRLLPHHMILEQNEVSDQTRKKLQESLVLVHGGMAQDVGPVLEMVTEKYLLRSEKEWRWRQAAIRLLDEIVRALHAGDIKSIGAATQRNFDWPIQTIIPWATNFYTESLINQVRQEFGEHFWGFWMLGGMSGGGMGFIFDPSVKRKAQARLAVIMKETKDLMSKGMPFAMDPVVYNFSINERGTKAELKQGDEALMPAEYYIQTVPALLRRETRELSFSRRLELDRFGTACRTDPELSGMVSTLFDHMLPHLERQAQSGDQLAQIKQQYGFDVQQHEQVRSDLRSGRIGIAQNRIPGRSRIRDARPGEVLNATRTLPDSLRMLGLDALKAGAVAVVTLAGGVGSRWTRGAGVVKGLNPFCKFAGKHRTFLEVHLAKSRRVSNRCGTPLAHIFTTSYLTHGPISAFLKRVNNYDYKGPLMLSKGMNVGLRMIPMERDLRYAWEEMPQQMLDEQAQKVRESFQAAMINWVRDTGEGNDYTDNLPLQCLHPVGHWYDVVNLFRSGALLHLLNERPQLNFLLVHNIDTLGTDIDPGLLGYHIEQDATLTCELISRRIEDRGGGLARVDGHLRLVEGLALPHEALEYDLSYYNTNTSWLNINRLLGVFGLTREDLADQVKVTEAIREVSQRIPTYVTLKDVKKRWGKGQEDIFPVTQFEKLWGDITSLKEVDARYIMVSRMRGQQLKEPANLDGWLRDQSARYVNALCDWE